MKVQTMKLLLNVHEMYFIVEDCSDGSNDSDYDSDSYGEEESKGDNVLEDVDPSTVTVNVLATFEKYFLGYEGGRKKAKKVAIQCRNTDMTSFDNIFYINLLREKWLTWASTTGRGRVLGRGHLPGTS